MKREIHPPFTERWVLTGPDVAISCDVEWNAEEECFHARSSAGFHATGASEVDAALGCFTAWMTSRHAWFVPTESEKRRLAREAAEELAAKVVLRGSEFGTDAPDEVERITAELEAVLLSAAGITK